MDLKAFYYEEALQETSFFHQRWPLKTSSEAAENEQDENRKTQQMFERGAKEIQREATKVTTAEHTDFKKHLSLRFSCTGTSRVSICMTHD